MGPTWGPSGSDRTQVGPMLAPWTLLSGISSIPTTKHMICTKANLWPWPLSNNLEMLINSGHYKYKCVFQVWEQSLQCILRYHVDIIYTKAIPMETHTNWPNSKFLNFNKNKLVTINSPKSTSILNIMDLSWQMWSGMKLLKLNKTITNVYVKFESNPSSVFIIYYAHTINMAVCRQVMDGYHLSHNPSDACGPFY